MTQQTEQFELNLILLGGKL